jgi:hypothetical protein
VCWLKFRPGHSGLVRFRNHPEGKYKFTGFTITVGFGNTAQPKVLGKVRGIVYRAIATHLTHKAGYTKSTAHTVATAPPRAELLEGI